LPLLVAACYVVAAAKTEEGWSKNPFSFSFFFTPLFLFFYSLIL